MYRLIYFLLTTFLVLQCNLGNGQEKNKSDEPQSLDYPHYEIAVQIDVENAYIEVEGILTLSKKCVPQESLNFYLDSGLKINTFKYNKTVAFKKDSILPGIRYMPAAIRLGSKDELQWNDVNEFSFSYSGVLSELPEFFANKISPDWVEMGLYYPWFPFSDQLNLFTYTVEITIDEGYTVFGLGNTKSNKNKFILENKNPSNDMVVCASKDVKIRSHQAGKNKLILYYHDLTDSVIDKMQNDLGRIINQLGAYFGDDTRQVNIILSKREKGGGYGRIGGMFLGGFNAEQFYEYNEGYNRYFAHEFSHMWWYKADTKSWEDWLNEGFAEYTSLMVVRDIFGEESFQKRIQTKKEAIVNTPPIWVLQEVICLLIQQ
jgi:hypothetical protein